MTSLKLRFLISEMLLVLIGVSVAGMKYRVQKHSERKGFNWLTCPRSQSSEGSQGRNPNETGTEAEAMEERCLPCLCDLLTLVFYTMSPRLAAVTVVWARLREALKGMPYSLGNRHSGSGIVLTELPISI